MRKTLNILLGALIALLTGCKTQQTPAVQENRIMVMYGPPTYFQQQSAEQQDTSLQETPADNNEANTTLPITH